MSPSLTRLGTFLGWGLIVVAIAYFGAHVVWMVLRG